MRLIPDVTDLPLRPPSVVAKTSRRRRRASTSFRILIVGLPDPALADAVRRLAEDVAPRTRALLGV